MKSSGSGKENRSSAMNETDKARKLPAWMIKAAASVDGEEWGEGKKGKAGPNTPKKGAAKKRETTKPAKADYVSPCPSPSPRKTCPSPSPRKRTAAHDVSDDEDDDVPTKARKVSPAKGHDVSDSEDSAATTPSRSPVTKRSPAKNTHAISDDDDEPKTSPAPKRSPAKGAHAISDDDSASPSPKRLSTPAKSPKKSTHLVSDDEDEEKVARTPTKSPKKAAHALSDDEDGGVARKKAGAAGGGVFPTIITKADFEDSEDIEGTIYARSVMLLAQSRLNFAFSASSSSDLPKKRLPPKAIPSRPSCPYGASCYRKNPQHLEDEAHPGDVDYKSSGEAAEVSKFLP